MNEKLAITEVIKSYFLSTYHGDVIQLKKIFHPLIHITGILNNQLVDWTSAEFIKRIMSSPTAASKGEKFDKEIIFIDQTNDVAIVKARAFVGTNTFIDYISMLRVDGKWLIRNKFFTN
jgi:hypothetical protein